MPSFRSCALQRSSQIDPVILTVLGQIKAFITLSISNLQHGRPSGTVVALTRVAACDMRQCYYS